MLSSARRLAVLLLALAPLPARAQAGDAELLARFCGDTARAADLGALVGRVRSADDDRPLAGVVVVVRWNELGVDRARGAALVTPRTLSAVSDSQALYRFCALPRQVPIIAQVQAENRSSGVIEIRLGEEPVRVHGFSLSLRGQTDSATAGTARLLGEVVGTNGQAIRDARVNLDGSPTFAISNDTGVFLLPNLPAGSQSLIIRRLGFLPKRLPVELRSGATTPVIVVLDQTVRVLDSVRVLAQRTRSQEEFMADFQKRKRASPGGIFLTDEQLARRVYTDTPDIFRTIPGLVVSTDGVVSLTRGALSMTELACVPTVYIDDVRIGDSTVDIVRPQEIRAIEVYKSAASVPPQYNDPCGAIVIWTK